MNILNLQSFLYVGETNLAASFLCAKKWRYDCVNLATFEAYLSVMRVHPVKINARGVKWTYFCDVQSDLHYGKLIIGILISFERTECRCDFATFCIYV